jgi:hypothetical protein
MDSFGIYLCLPSHPSVINESRDFIDLHFKSPLYSLIMGIQLAPRVWKDVNV